MRSVAFVLLTPLLACRATTPVDQIAPDGATGDDAGMQQQPPARGFQLISPTVVINPGAEISYCYYFQTSNTSELAIRRWTTRTTPGVHDTILWLTPNDQQPPGTMSTTDCGIIKQAAGPVWTYAAGSADTDVT